MLDPNEINEALGLLNLSTHYYRVRRTPNSPSALVGTTVHGATYEDGILVVTTDGGQIRFGPFEEFRLFPDGTIKVFWRAEDERPALELITPRVDLDYLDALAAANQRLGRPENELPRGLEPSS